MEDKTYDISWDIYLANRYRDYILCIYTLSFIMTI